MNEIVKIALTEGAKKGLNLAFDTLATFARKSRAEIITPESEIKEALEQHRNEVQSWSSEISFSESALSRLLKDFFIPLNIYVGQRRSLIAGEPTREVNLEDELASEVRSFVILGQPGAGKTTAIKHICSRFLSDEDFLPSYAHIIRFQLRDLNSAQLTANPEYIRRQLQDLLHIRFSFGSDLTGDEQNGARRAIRDQSLATWLNTARVLLVLDGFDEITHKAKRDLLIDELRLLTNQLNASSFLLTTRTGEFHSHIERAKTIEIKPFSQDQIANFSVRWLGSNNAPVFLNQLTKSPFWDTAIRPLTLAHLCVIFEKYGRIPNKPKTVYKKIVRLLIEDWDQEKSVQRESAYADFEPDRKEDFLAHLAYEITRSLKSTSFTEQGLKKSYEVISGNFGLPLREATKVVAELETHTGLILNSGQDLYEFSHKSLQEYLAAEHIVKMAQIPSNMFELQIMPNELAVATAISSEPSEYLTVLVAEHFSRIRTSFDFTRSFVSRLLLENPDFEETPRVGFALLTLYSQYLRAILHEDHQRSLFLMDSLSEEFSSLASKIRSRVAIKEVEQIYERLETTHTFEGDTVWHLQRRGKGQLSLSRADLSLLPTELWVRGTLLASQESLNDLASN